MQKNVNPYRSRFWQGTTNGTPVFYPALLIWQTSPLIMLISSEYSASKLWYPLWASSAAEGKPRLSSCMSWAHLSALSGKKADSGICLVLCAWTLCNAMREFWPLHALMGSWVQFRPHSPVSHIVVNLSVLKPQYLRWLYTMLIYTLHAWCQTSVQKYQQFLISYWTEDYFGS